MSVARKKPVVWVTRPEPGASQTCEQLRLRRYDAHALPLTHIAGLLTEADCVSRRAAFADKDVVVAATSANAIRHLPDSLLESLRERPLFAVGHATADAAYEAGFRHIRVGPSDGAQLAQMVVNQIGSAQNVVYLAGSTRTGTFEDGLVALGAMLLMIIDVYATEKVSQIAYIAKAVKAGDLPDAVLLYSVYAASLFAQQMQASKAMDVIENMHLFCLSQRVADALGDFDAAYRLISANPTQESILEALEMHLPQGG